MGRRDLTSVNTATLSPTNIRDLVYSMPRAAAARGSGIQGTCCAGPSVAVILARTVTARMALSPR